MIKIQVSEFDTLAGNLISKLPPYTKPFFKLASSIGHPITICLVGGLVVLCGITYNKQAILLSGLVIWLALALSTTLKHVIERSRPLTEYVAHMRISSFSFPSGHTAGSTAAYGILAYYAAHLLTSPLNLIVATALGVVILSIGISRIYLGAHYPSDVIGGWIVGAAAVASVVLFVGPLL